MTGTDSSSTSGGAMLIDKTSVLVDVAGDSLARQACTTCRRQKRRCSRELPSCALCRKNRRACSYPPEALDGVPTHHSSPDEDGMAASAGASGATAPATSSMLSRTTIHDQDRNHQASPRHFLTNLFFLDSCVFEMQKAEVRRPLPDLPPETVRLLLDDADTLRADAEIYIAQLHPSFPISKSFHLFPFASESCSSFVSLSFAHDYHSNPCAVSKLRLRRDLANQAGCPSDTLFLFLVIRLLCRSVSDADSPSADVLYDHVRHCDEVLSAAGCITLRRLQGMLLLAYYEIANALFPTAYMTVGTCARLGQIIGIHSNPDAVRTTVKKFSQHDDEERLRAWWATLILDRYVTIGLDDRPFVCRTARPDDYLPMDDQVWDRGETTFRPALALSTDMTASSNPFAHTCQAAHLLSHVLRHTNDTRPVTPEDYEAFYAEGMQLQKLVESFTYALWTVVQDAVAAAALSRIQHPDIADHPAYSPISLFPAFAIALSAQLCFYDVHVCADIDHPRAKGLASQQKMQMSALDGVKAVLKVILGFSEMISDAVRQELDLRLQDQHQGGQRAESNGQVNGQELLYTFGFAGYQANNGYQSGPENSAPSSSTASATPGSSPSFSLPLSLGPLVSPLTTNCLYQAAKFLSWYYRDVGREDILQSLVAVKTTIKDLAKLWPVADVCLTILELDCFKPES